MAKPGQIFRRVVDSVLDGGMSAQRLRGMTDNLGVHFGDVNTRTGRIDVFDGSGGNGGPMHGPDLPNPSGDGPVEFRIPEGATDAEAAQFHDYVNRSNQYLADGSLSDSGRVSTAGEISREARREARLERLRAEAAGTPYDGVAAHVPDSTWVGQGKPPGWGDYTSRVNSSLAGQVNRYPVGHNPTIFIVRE